MAVIDERGISNRVEGILVKVYEMAQTPQSSVYIVRRETIGWATREMGKLIESIKKDKKC